MEILSKLFGKKTTVHKTEKPFEKMTQAEKLHDVAVYIQANAEDGDAQCQFDYGMMLVSGTGPHGHGVYRQNEDAGIQWLKKSAQQGHEQAQAMLGKIYADRGNGAEAVKFYHMASEQGHIDATINLAMMYGSGDVVTKDSEKAHILFLKAANQGDPFAQYRAEEIYAITCFSSTDYSNAQVWYLSGAENKCILWLSEEEAELICRIVPLLPDWLTGRIIVSIDEIDDFVSDIKRKYF